MKLYCRAPSVDDPSHTNCRTCDGYLGQSPYDVYFIGVVRRRTPRKHLDHPKDVRQCKKCGWWNIYTPNGKGVA